ncbi:sulfate transporter 4.1, chloroplastic isoform X2 [Coffea arabica]|uniref:Sulfate transporter 4.1, chloroplastic isoform X2 n=1 Tax=Coffea arabica TaxID=13443 RepID=A0ABM4WS95_COFAR
MEDEGEADDVDGVDRDVPSLLPLDSNLQMARIFANRSHGWPHRRHHARSSVNVLCKACRASADIWTLHWFRAYICICYIRIVAPACYWPSCISFPSGFKCLGSHSGLLRGVIHRACHIAGTNGWYIGMHNGSLKFLWPPFVMGSVMLAILLIMKAMGKRKHLRFLRAAGPLTAVVLGTTFVKIYHPSSISLVGDIPQGLPKFSIPKEFGHVTSLIPTAILITGVAILESVGIAKALAAKNGYELDSNQELFGLGVANIVGSFFSIYPTTGSFSRSAVNHESGAKTGLSGIVMGIIMGCALLFMTPLFEYIPQCVLAAIVISAVIGLVDYDEAVFLWRVDKKDFLLWMITCITTLFLGIEIGVLVGVGASLAFVIHESANPHVAVLGRLPGTTVYRNIEQYPEAYTYNGIVIVRVDSPIYFANISYIEDRLREYEYEIDVSTSRGPEVERIYFVIIEMAPVTYIDSSAVQALKDLYQEYKSRNIQVAISNPNRDVLLTLTRSGLVDLIGKEWYFVRVHDAVQVCLQHVQNLNGAHKKSSESLVDDRPSFLRRLMKQRAEEFSSTDLETGHKSTLGSKDSDSQLEPLLFRK